MRNRASVVCYLFVCGLQLAMGIPASAESTDCLDYGDYYPDAAPQAGQLPGNGAAADVLVMDECIAMATSAGVLFFHCTDPADPGYVGRTSSTAGVIAGAGDFIYAVENEAPLQVIDISDPAQPLIVGTVHLGDWFNASAVTVHDSYVYVGASWSSPNGKVVDISDPTQPQVVSSFESHGLGRIEIVGQYLLGAGGIGDTSSGHVSVFDLNDLGQPLFLDALAFNGPVVDMVVHDDHAFVCGSFGITVLNIADPESIEIVTSVPGVTYASELSISGSKLHAWAEVSTGIQSLAIIDVSNPAAPVVVGTTPGPDIVRGLAARGSYFYAAASYDGLKVIDIADPAEPEMLPWAGMPGLAGYAVNVYEQDEYALVHCVGGIDLQVVDISEPTALQIVAEIELGEPTVQCSFKDGPLFYWVHVVQSEDDDRSTGILGILDVSTPTAPVELSTLPLPGTPRVVATVGEYVYAPAYWGSSGLYIVDVSDPSDPVLAETISGFGAPVAMQKVGTLLFAAFENSGLRIYDVAAPLAPELIGSIETGYATDVVVAGDLAFVADRWDGLLSIDVSDPTAPFIVDNVATPDMTMSVEYAEPFVYAGDNVLRVMRVTETGGLIPIGWTQSNGLTSDITATNQWVLASNGNGGLNILHHACPAIAGSIEGEGTPARSARFLSIYPNPFNPVTTVTYTLPQTARVQIAAYDLTGRLINVLAEGVVEAGQHSLVWQGTDNQGRAVASGTYMLTLETEEGMETRKMVLLK